MTRERAFVEFNAMISDPSNADIRLIDDIELHEVCEIFSIPVGYGNGIELFTKGNKKDIYGLSIDGLKSTHSNLISLDKPWKIYNITVLNWILT